MDKTLKKEEVLKIITAALPCYRKLDIMNFSELAKEILINLNRKGYTISVNKEVSK